MVIDRSGTRVSHFGVYEGYSQACFDGFERTSVHVVVRDGTRLAIDIFRPTLVERLHDEPLPVVLQMTPYNRAQIVDGRLTHALSPYPAPPGRGFNNLAALLAHGYVIACFDVRGQGASFGAYTGCFTIEEGHDAADVIAWLRGQRWCSGRIGMLGSSYGGQTQFLAAAERPPGLAALFPCHSLFDAYDVHFPGGIADLVIPRDWGAMIDALAGRTAQSAAAPVDGAAGTKLLDEAVREHRATRGAIAVFAPIYASRFRDGTGFFDRASASGSQNLVTLLPRLAAAAIPAYHWGGWNDYYPGHAARWYRNWLRFAPARLTLGPWTHSPRTFTSPRDDEDLRLRFVESLRWFDRWLKDIDNGVETEESVHYAVQDGHRYREGAFEDDDDRWTWRASRSWPPDGSKLQRWTLGRGPDSSDAGLLRQDANADRSTMTVRIDPSVSTGAQNRLGAAMHGAPHRFPEMSTIDARCASWTSAPLVADLVVVGAPIVSITLSASCPDVALVAWLEEVDAAGRSTLITYGQLRASHRALGEAPYDNLDEPWHPGTRTLVASTPGLDSGPAVVEFALVPVASRFATGRRVRLTLGFADDGNLERVASEGTVTFFFGPNGSFVRLPVEMKGEVVPEPSDE